MDHSILQEFVHNVVHNLFKPLLLFFYMGFLIPILRVPFEFPKVIYQGITIFLLVAIGWHGGEELASLGTHEFLQAGGFMIIGFITNAAIGFLAYLFLRSMTRLRRIDAATIGAYYGSDSAGTFVTCVGVLTGLMLVQKTAQAAGELPADLPPYENFAYAQYMPVMLAVMEIPGCLVGLAQIARLRRNGMDRWGNMPDEPGYNQPPTNVPVVHGHDDGHETHGNGAHAAPAAKRIHGGTSSGPATAVAEAEEEVVVREAAAAPRRKPEGFFSPKVLHEVFFNPGLYLLFGGIVVGFIGRRQGPTVTAVDDPFFVTMFQGVLCLFLLEMGMTACQRLRDLKTAGVPFILFGVIAPNIFATIGIVVAHLYSHALGEPFTLGTYPLFAVLCGAASYIAVPAVQRMAIPEASPTLPLAASLGLTFSYNVTIGIPLYIEIAKAITKAWPVVVAAHGA